MLSRDLTTDQRADALLPDDPSRPTDPTWEELDAQLREAGLSWSDLGTWAPTEEPEPPPVWPGGGSSCWP
jgi:hypothetical protein